MLTDGNDIGIDLVWKEGPYQGRISSAASQDPLGRFLGLSYVFVRCVVFLYAIGFLLDPIMISDYLQTVSSGAGDVINLANFISCGIIRTRKP
jgi:hypothetical protein